MSTNLIYIYMQIWHETCSVLSSCDSSRMQASMPVNETSGVLLEVLSSENNQRKYKWCKVFFWLDKRKISLN